MTLNGKMELPLVTFIVVFIFPVNSQLFGRSVNDLDGLQKATDKFAVTLYKTLTTETQRAANATHNELGDALGLNELTGSNSDIARTYSTVADILRFGNQATGKRNYQLSLANRICLQNKLVLKQEFLNSTFGSDIRNYNFEAQPESARLEINAWVGNVTNGKIRNLLTAGQVGTNTIMMIISAIYFKADWQYQFDKSATSDMKFFKGDQIIKAKMMTVRRRFYYTESEELKAQMVEIPYKSEELSMLILLPNETDGLPALERNLTVKLWEGLQDRTDLKMVALTLPKFKLEESYDMIEPLRSLGINSLFDAADLSGMLKNGLIVGVSGVVHKSFVEVNEEGTEAAAATGVVFSRSAVFTKPDEVKEFKADHPFLFAIRHNPTNLVLFMGRVGDPST